MMNTQLVLFFTLFEVTLGSMPLAILHVEGHLGSADVCALYNPHYSSIPMRLADTPKFKIFIPKPPSGCEDYVDLRNAWNSSTFVTTGDNCSLPEKLQRAYHANAKQVVVISDRNSLTDLPNGSPGQHGQVHLSVGVIADTSWKSVQENLGSPLYAQLYHPHDPLFDPNLIVLWLIAVFTVVIGSYWCGLTLERSGSRVIDQSFLDLERSFLTDKKASLSSDDHSYELNGNEADSFPLSTIMVFVFIFMICTVLLSLYFFYKYLIFVVIGMFAIASVSGTYECISSLLSLVDCGKCRIPENNLPLLKHQPQIRNIIVLLLCIGLSIYWVIIRNTSYSWVLQDFLGICFCISLIKLIKLPNFKIGTILLLALLVYDIFFVFITPLFSARGKSIMVEVATGNGSKEQLPMVIRVPKIIKTALSICERPYSILGFGDILLPGLFVAFCHNFDVIAKTKYKVYFVATSIAYGFGLVATFVALMMMKVGQPALLYLAPSVLLACFIVGFARGELKSLWRGAVDVQPRRLDLGEEEGHTDSSDEEYNLLGNTKKIDR